MQTNNKLREALEAIISGYEKSDLCDMNYGEWCHEPANICVNVPLCKAIHEARAALAAPLRNCDRFKTAAEAAHRRERGDCAKLREALEKIRAIAKTFMDATQMRRVTDSARIDVGNIKDLADAALAEPVKNCEVGTVEQQVKRFEKYCESEVCKRNRCKSQAKALCIERCALAWGQLSYEEGGAK